MAIVETTSKQFRERQKYFFDMADNGEQVIIKRGRKQAYVLTPIPDDEAYFTLEMVKRIKQAQQEIKEGKGITFNSAEELDRYLKSL